MSVIIVLFIRVHSIPRNQGSINASGNRPGDAEQLYAKQANASVSAGNATPEMGNPTTVGSSLQRPDGTRPINTPVRSVVSVAVTQQTYRQALGNTQAPSFTLAQADENCICLQNALPPP